MSRRIAVVVGTRPEVIKLAPIILEAQARPEFFELKVITTGQHRELMGQMLAEFSIVPDVDLAIMRPNQGLSETLTAAVDGLSRVFAELSPEAVFVQGDTTTTFAGALAAFYRRIRVAHVEAGLRTFDRDQPFPEEANRCLTTQLADWHFAPTSVARDHLLREGIAPARIFVTGNTSIDALRITRGKLDAQAGKGSQTEPRRLILLTAHRRENHGEPLQRICAAVREIVARHPDVHVLFPVHPNPNVQDTVRVLAGHPRIELCQPLGYREFVGAMQAADVLLTDSGGLQEEGPALGKPVLVLRETTERPEAVTAGVAKLIGTATAAIVENVSTLLTSPQAYRAMANGNSPYGDGYAARTIMDVISRDSSLASGVRSH